MTIIQRGSMLQYLMVLFFIFSTIYTLAYYYEQGSRQGFSYSELQDRDDNTLPSNPSSSSWLSTVVSGSLDWIFEILSWFTPFALVKGLIYIITPSDVYQFLKLLILRPVGWIGTFISAEWVINKLRGVSE